MNTPHTPTPGVLTLADTPQAAQSPRQRERGASTGEPRTPRKPRASEVASCARCGAEWTGTRVCHCGACHATFGGLSLFDAHRHNRGERGGCLDPATVDGLEYRDGMWRGPEMTDEAKAKAFGGAR